MKLLKIYFFVVILFFFAFSISTFAQKGETNDKPKATDKYDDKLAKELGADQYGMKSYVLVVLKTGNTEIKDEKKRNELFAGHFSNMGKMASEGKLVLAGPLSDENKVKRGIFILNVKTIEEAQELVLTDPAVKAGIFDYELTKFYGSAALMKINEIHSQIQKTPI